MSAPKNKANSETTDSEPAESPSGSENLMDGVDSRSFTRRDSQVPAQPGSHVPARPDSQMQAHRDSDTSGLTESADVIAASDGRDKDLGKDADAVLRVGELLLCAGTDSYRIVRAMKRTARSLQFDRFDASISLTSIRFTARRAENFRTEVCVIKQPGIDASLIEMIEDLTHHLPDRVSAQWVNRQLDEIEHRRRVRWNPAVLAVAAGVACAAFAVLNHFSFVSACAVAVGAAVGQCVRIAAGRSHFNQLGAAAAAGVTACVTYYVLIKGLALADVIDSPTSLESGYVAAVLFLVPGFPLFTSLIDMARFDFAAGWERFLYATGLIVSATAAAWVVSSMTGLHPEIPASAEQSEWLWLVVAGVASACGIAGFALLFNSSRRMVAIAAVVGTLANLVKFVALHLGVPSQLACLIGGVSIGLVASLIRTSAAIPRITITIPAAVIMIPGTSMFRCMYYLNIGDINQALTHGVTSALQVFSIAAGLVVARLVTDRDWARNRHIDFSHRADHSDGRWV